MHGSLIYSVLYKLILFQINVYETSSLNKLCISEKQMINKQHPIPPKITDILKDWNLSISKEQSKSHIYNFL